MSKISYCSLEEAWGDTYKKKDDNKEDTKYDYLNKISKIERDVLVDNMNQVERKAVCQDDTIMEYNKYRLNPVNTVTKNDTKQEYSPFNESIEKKYLQDKLNFLENEFRKYKHLFEKNESEEKIDTIESFTNSTPEEKYKNNDIIDLILLIIIGLIIILVMNSIFNIGKNIGLRNKIV